MTMPNMTPAGRLADIMPLAVLGTPPRGEARVPRPDAVAAMKAGADAADAVPALIVLGRDDSDRPHASWFTADEAELAAKAAGLMEMAALPVEGDALAALAAKLPHGRVFASGKAFVPFVRAATFDDLVRHLSAGVTGPSRSRKESEPARAAAKGGRKREAAVNEAAKSEAGEGPAIEPGATEAYALPGDWPEIAPGCLVLASEGGSDGWYESVVLEEKAENEFVLQWRDWPDLPTFTRRLDQLGLLHPTYVAG
ncbi:hypothetical protein [Aureimonas psammosilenae]|uniref:hypothetical protein n=1 Tax=Aureimonas psammosilenae TaxID=2495496 RepID=UPI001260DB39|nr:hypothetical protein [Aureimonas psammosilenae]